jgi:hypothetical protein
VLRKIHNLTPKQAVVAGVFTLALAGSVGLGLVVNNQLSAAMPRDCDDNAILKCGAADRNELVADARSNNAGTQRDIQPIYAHFGLTFSEYDRYAQTARQGEFRRNGEVWVDGQMVMRSTLSIGRHNFGGSKSISIGGKTYFQGTPNQRWASGVQSIPVMVMFDKNGTVEIAIMNPCGNPAEGEKIKSGGACEALNMTAVSGKENTYNFTTNTSTFGNGTIAKVVYNFGDGSAEHTETDPKKPVQHTFTKDATVTVKVFVNVPGKQQVVVESVKCKKQVTFKKKEVFHVCKALIATARDNTNRSFRFTVRTEQKNATVKDVDFTLDGAVTTTGVTAKDAQGNIFKDYSFTDNVKHTMAAKVNFLVDGKTVSAPELCKAEVTPEKPPVCIHNPNLPPEHPDCLPPKTPECPEKPGSGFPPGDPRCKELPKTGPASLLGLFAGASIFGGAAHKILLRRRAGRIE